MVTYEPSISDMHAQRVRTGYYIMEGMDIFRQRDGVWVVEDDGQLVGPGFRTLSEAKEHIYDLVTGRKDDADPFSNKCGDCGYVVGSCACHDVMTDQANNYAAAIGACRFAAHKVAEPGPWGQGKCDAVSRAFHAVADALEHMGGEDATS